VPDVEAPPPQSQNPDPQAHATVRGTSTMQTFLQSLQAFSTTSTTSSSTTALPPVTVAHDTLRALAARAHPNLAPPPLGSANRAAVREAFGLSDAAAAADSAAAEAHEAERLARSIPDPAATSPVHAQMTAADVETEGITVGGAAGQGRSPRGGSGKADPFSAADRIVTSPRGASFGCKCTLWLEFNLWSDAVKKQSSIVATWRQSHSVVSRQAPTDAH
jgi:hypothetical protein